MDCDRRTLGSPGGFGNWAECVVTSEIFAVVKTMPDKRRQTELGLRLASVD
ncbi:MAG: hypothetical protein ACK58L_10790 [Planctomycetota bacterium]